MKNLGVTDNSGDYLNRFHNATLAAAEFLKQNQIEKYQIKTPLPQNMQVILKKPESLISSRYYYIGSYGFTAVELLKHINKIIKENGISSSEFSLDELVTEVESIRANTNSG